LYLYLKAEYLLHLWCSSNWNSSCDHDHSAFIV